MIRPPGRFCLNVAAPKGATKVLSLLWRALIVSFLLLRWDSALWPAARLGYAPAFPAPQLWALAVKGTSGRLSGRMALVCRRAVHDQCGTCQPRAWKQLGVLSWPRGWVSMAVFHPRASCTLCWKQKKLEPLCSELPLENYRLLKTQRESPLRASWPRS